MLRSIAIAAAIGLVSSSAMAAGRTYEVPAFTEVSIGSGIAAIVDVGGAQAVSADAPTDAILERLDVTVHGRRLEISLKSNAVDWLFNIGANKGVSVHVAVPVLSAADSNSGADVDVHGLQAETVRLTASSGAGLSADGIASRYVTLDSSSGANLTATGSCSKLIANASSGAGIAAAGLSCSDVNADASSGAHVEVRATGSVNANASVGAGIVIHGHPAQANANSSVGGSVSYAD